MKRLCLLILMSMLSFSAKAGTITMYGKDRYGFEQPKYTKAFKGGFQDTKLLNLKAFAKPNNFPFSSNEQGSIFDKIFSDLEDLNIGDIILIYPKIDYKEATDIFERGRIKDINSRFGVYFAEYIYSSNSFIYPAFFENKVYIITSADKRLSLSSKAELKNYKGIYAASDDISDLVLKDFQSLGMRKVETFSDAFKEVLTGKADYLAASYYPSLIAMYKEGIRSYMAYSKDAVWKMAMFLRADDSIMNHPKLPRLKAYLGSAQYKKKRDDAFNELVEIYRKNTEGIVPPTYLTESKETKDEEE